MFYTFWLLRGDGGSQAPFNTGCTLFSRMHHGTTTEMSLEWVKLGYVSFLFGLILTT